MFNGVSKRIVVLSALVIAGSSLGVLMVRSEVIQSNREVMLHLDTIVDFQATVSNLANAEAGQRGYLLTGDESYLKPYSQGLHGTRTNLKYLQDEAAVGDLPGEEVTQLSYLISRKLEELQQIIDLRRRQGLPAAIAVVNTHSGKNLTDSIHTQIEQMTEIEESALVAAKRHVDRLTRYGNWIIASWTVLNLTALVWTYHRTNREIENRLQERARLQRQVDLFSVTMEGIRDGVIVTDAEGRVTALSEAAERLTGWNSRDAVHQTYEDVFRLRNDGTPRKQDDTLEQVRSAGRAVRGLGHSILVRRQGDTIPVDYSASRLNEVHGKMQGMVLFFRETATQLAGEPQRLG